MAVSALITAATVYTVNEQREARKDQKRANARARRIEDVRSQRERMRALQTNRINAAQVFAQAGNAGVGGSSGVQGTLAAFGTQAAGNWNFATTVNTLNQERMRALDSAEGHLARASYGQAAAGLAASLPIRPAPISIPGGG